MKERVSVSNMGMSKGGPVIEGRDRLLLEFTDGSVCISDGQRLTYTTHIHLVCSRGSEVRPLCSSNGKVDTECCFCVQHVTLFVFHTVKSTGPQFLMYQNCTANFRWETRAACAITTTENDVSSEITTIY